MQQTLPAQIRRHGAVFFGVKQDESIHLCIGHHALNGIQHFGIVLTGDDRIHILPLVAKLSDAADNLQMERIFVDVPLRRRQNNTDGLGKRLHRFRFKIWLIAQLCHDAAHSFLGVPTDGRAVLAGARNCGRRNASRRRDIFDGNCHNLFLPD